MGSIGRDRRKEARHTATGKVEFRLAEPVPEEFEGRLIDVSKSGFRAAHQFAMLQAGQELHYSYAESRGRARAMWTTVISGRIETGFLKL